MHFFILDLIFQKRFCGGIYFHWLLRSRNVCRETQHVLHLNEPVRFKDALRVIAI